MSIFAIEATTYNPDTPGTQVNRWATVDFTTGSADTPAHVSFEGRLKKGAWMRRDIVAEGKTRGKSAVGYGDATLANDDGVLDFLRKHGIAGYEFKMYRGEFGDQFPDEWEEVVVTTMEQVEYRGRSEVSIKLRDRQAELDLPLQTNRYAGSGGLEGDSELEGKEEPFCFGDNFNVPAVLVDKVKNIYQVADGAVDSIPNVRDRGINLNQTPATWVDRTSGTLATLMAPIVHGQNMIAGGAAGEVRISSDAGANWAADTTPPWTTGSTPVIGKVATGTVGGDGVSGSSTSRTTTIVIPSGTDKILIVAIAIVGSSTGGDSVSSVVSDIDGALTKLDHAEDTTGSQARVEIWYKKAPSTGTHVVTATYALTTRSIVMSTCWENVHQTSTFGTVAKANTGADAASPATVNVSSAAGEVVIDVVGKRDTNETLTIGAGQTLGAQGETGSATSSQNVQGGHSHEAGAASVTMSWTYTNNRSWAIMGVALKPSAATAGDAKSGDYDPVIGKAVIGGTSGKLAYSSDFGDNWTEITGGSNPFGATETVRRIVSNKLGHFVAVGSLGTVAYSTNGTSFSACSDGSGAWSAAQTDVAYGQGTWVVTNLSSAGHVYHSPDGINFEPLAFSFTSTVSAIAYGAGPDIWVVAAGGNFWTSKDARAWNYLQSHNPIFVVHSIVYGGAAKLFWVSGENTVSTGAVLVSRDGKLWDMYPPIQNGAQFAFMAADDTYVLYVANGGVIKTPATAGTYANVADLEDDDPTLVPERGTYKVYTGPEGTYIRLGSPAQGLVTADVIQGATAADRTAAKLFAAVLTKMGMDAPPTTNLVAAVSSWANGVATVGSGISDPIGGTTAFTLTDDDAGVQEAKSYATTFTGDGVKGACFVVRERTSPASGQYLAIYDSSAAAYRLQLAITSWRGGRPIVSEVVGTLLDVIYVGNGYWAVFGSSTAVTAANNHLFAIYPAWVAGETGAIDVWKGYAYNATDPLSGDWLHVDTDLLDLAQDAELGFWIALEEALASEVLSLCAISVRAWWGVDRKGYFRIKRIVAPTSVSSIQTFVDHDGVGEMERLVSPDGLPTYSTIVRYRKNWSPQTDLAASLTPEEQLVYRVPWKVQSDTEASVRTKHPNAPEFTLDSLLVYEADALAEAQGREDLWGADRELFSWEVPLDDETVVRDLGEIVTFEYDRFDLSAGKKLMIVSLQPDTEEKTVVIGAWG